MKDEAIRTDRPGQSRQAAAPWFRALVEQSPLGISVARDGITLYANHSCARLFGYDSPDEFVGTSQLNRVAPECRSQVKEYMLRRKRGEPAPLSYEITGLRRDGSTFPLYVEVIRVEWEGGPVTMAYFTDFTARKAMEEALRQARDELEARIRERTEELAGVNEKLLNDIAERLRVEEALRQREQELAQRSIKLEELNVTLRTILEQRNEDCTNLEQQIVSNINDLVKPLLEKLRTCRSEAQRLHCLQIIESNLDAIISPFSCRLTGERARLTATEMQVADCIRQGMRSKEIAALLRLSKGTIDFHRNNIRRKLGISDRKTSLRSHLISLDSKIQDSKRKRQDRD